MRTGQPKPGYNARIGTENGFVAGCDMFPNPTDGRTLKPHLRQRKKRPGTSPRAAMADAGRGSEENYRRLENGKAAAGIKHGMRRKERGRKWKEDIWETENRPYDQQERHYVCPNGKRLVCRGSAERKTDAGRPITIDRHECESCEYCRPKKPCARAKGNRRTERNENRLRLKRKAKRALEDERYKELRRRRSAEVGTVF
jgi:transposase